MNIYIPKGDDVTVWVTLERQTFKLRIYLFRGLTYADISTDAGYVVVGLRVIQNQWLIPSYMSGGGNFRFESYKSDEDDYVEPSGFNTKFRLMSYTSEEITKLENG